MISNGRNFELGVCRLTNVPLRHMCWESGEIHARCVRIDSSDRSSKREPRNFKSVAS